jgi:hypothetical protein
METMKMFNLINPKLVIFWVVYLVLFFGVLGTVAFGSELCDGSIDRINIEGSKFEEELTVIQESTDKSRNTKFAEAYSRFITYKTLSQYEYNRSVINCGNNLDTQSAKMAVDLTVSRYHRYLSTLRFLLNDT